MKKILLTATVQSHICQFHRPLVQMLRESGEYEIHVAARNNLMEKNGLQLDFADKVFDVPFERSPFHPKNLRAYRQLKKIISENDYRVIHCNTPVGGVVTRLAARKVRKCGTKVFYTAHGFHFYQGAPKKNWLIYYPIEWLLARLTDTLITINDEDCRFAKDRFPCQVSHIHGVGVDAERYRPAAGDEIPLLKQHMGFDKEDKLILCVGELLPNKNQKMAIEAMKTVVASVPNARLLLAGNGPEKENLEARIREAGLENHVRLLGYCTNLEAYQRITSVAVSCSRREGLPLNIIEAMLCENPVIATHNRGHNELIVHGETGYLMDHEDTAFLAEQLIYLLKNPEEGQKMGVRGKNRALKYTKQAVQKELQNIYFA